MAISYSLMTLRVSRARGNSNQPPLAVRMYTLELEAAEPRYVYYSDTATDAEVHLLMLAALAAKAGNVSSSFRLDPTPLDGLLTGHDIDPVNPGSWTTVPGGTRALIHGLVDGTDVYYLGARL